MLRRRNGKRHASRRQRAPRVDAPGRSGFAHLFEHLMFMGTERVPANGIDAPMEAGGGHNNAATDEDSTHYFELGPSSMLPTFLWLEADRLEDLGRAMTQEKLDRQREVVRNEIREVVENRPYAEADEVVFEVMYPPDHPYHFGILGRHEDLEAATLRDVRTFFATFYVPNNMTLVIAGAFPPEPTRQLVRELFGSLVRGAPPPRRAAPPAALDRVVRRTLLDRVELPRIKMAWHAPARFAAGDAEMQLLGELLSDGKSSRLYRRLVERDRLAMDVAAYQDAFELGGLFQLDVTAAHGADLDAVERAVDEELAKLCAGGVTDDELAPRRAARELRQVAGLQRLGALAAQLAAYDAAYGDPAAFERDLARFRDVTPRSLTGWARRVLDPDARGILRVLPVESRRPASARDRRPRPEAAPEFAPPSPESFTLQNGIPVELWRDASLPMVSVLVQAVTGRPLDEPATAGLAALTAAMLREGAGERDAAAFADAVQRLGAWVAADADHDGATVALATLRRNLEPALDLLADAVRRPRLTAADWQRVQALQLDSLRALDSDADAIANRIALRELYGPDSSYGCPVAGTPETVAELTFDDVRRRWATLFAPANLRVLVAGDVTAGELRRWLDEDLGGAAPAASGDLPPAAPARPEASAPGALRVLVVDRPGAAQTVVRLALPGPRYGDPRRTAYELLGVVLGGTFDSRLNRTLREESGYGYGAGAGWTMGPAGGHFLAWTAVRSDATGAALRALLEDIRRPSGAGGGDVSAAEFAKAKETLRAGVVEACATQSSLLGRAAALARNDLPFATPREELRTLQDITAAELNALAPAAFALERGVLVLVGDVDTIVGQLPAAGLPEPIRLDVAGRPLVR